MAVMALNRSYEVDMTTDLAPQRHDDAGDQTPANRVTTTKSRVACNGGGGALGHPQIWLNLGVDGTVTCPYCSREFVKANG